MDLEMARRWQAGEAPFDGLTVSTEAYIPLTILRRALKSLVLRLNRHRPEAELFAIADWHFHDDYLSDSRPLAWAELMAIISSDEGLLAASPSDDLVFYGVFPDDREWYLRFYTPEVDDLPGNEFLTRHGRFDLTGPGRLVKPAADELSAQGLRVRVVPGIAFFHRTF